MKQYLIANNNNDNDNLANSAGTEVAVAITLLFVGILCTVLTSGYTSVFGIQPVLAASQFSVVSVTTPPPPSNVKIDISSAHKVNGIAGQFIKIEGIITNPSHNETINGGIAYISIVDIKNNSQ